MLNHDDGVGPGGQRVARVYRLRGALDCLYRRFRFHQLQPQRRSFGGPNRIFSAHGIAIHGAGVVMGR